MGIGVNPSYKLDVFGAINATNFRGNGSQITNLDAGNITSGVINVNRLPTSIVKTSGNQTIG